MGQVLKRYRKLPKSPLFGLTTALIVLSMSIMAGLRADANPMPTQTLSGSITTSQTLNPSFVYIVESGVAVESGATLTIPAGTIIKSKYKYGSFTVNAGGSLRVTGTSANPVHFTSIKDDTVGGDSNNDGNATSPSIEDYTRAILSNDGDVNVVFAKFRYFSNTAVDGFRTTGSIVVTDSTFDNGRAAIGASAPIVKLYRNKFNNLSPDSIQGAVSVSGIQDLTKISLSGIDQNVFTGTNKFSRIISLGRVTLPSGKSWTHASTSGATVQFVASNYINGIATIGTDTSLILQSSWRTIELRGTLNIQKGVWVKHAGTGALEVLPEGKLNVSGDATNPVHFTSLKDDTVGGDTNGDASASLPSIGDSHSVIVGENSDISISYAEFSYFGLPVGGSMDVLSVTDTKFRDSYAALSAYSANSAVLKRNIFNVSPDQYRFAVDLEGIPDISSISLSGPDANIFIGTPYQRIIKIGSSTLPAGKTFTLGTEGSPVLAINEGGTNIEGTINLATGSTTILRGNSWSYPLNLTGTLNVWEGSTIKFENSNGINVRQGAYLNVNGTVSSKAQFTGYKNDSIGGDTNGDGGNSVPSMDDASTMINIDGGSVYIINASFSYANRNITGHGPATSFKVFDSSFTNAGTAISVAAPNVKIYRNTFNLQTDSDFSPVSLTGVTDISRFGLSGIDQNFFTSTSPHSRIVEFRESTLPADKTLTLAQSSGAKLKFSGDKNNIYGTLNLADNSTLISDAYYSYAPNVYGALTIGKGSEIKMTTHSSGIVALSNGKVKFLGDSNNKIRVTHYSDDSIGGDTNGDGNYTAPQVGSYALATTHSGGEVIANFIDVFYAAVIFGSNGGKINSDNIRSSNSMQLLSAMSDSEITLTNAHISNASTAIKAIGNSKIIFRGSLINSQVKAIEACNWMQSCSVDAAYVDWGTGGAPATGSVCGQVTVSPWVGGSASSEGLFTSKNCDNSPTPADQLSSSTQHFGQRMSVRGIDCGNGFEDACEAMRRAQACLSGAVDVASSTSPFPLPGSQPHEQATTWGQSLADGATTYIQAIESPTPQLSALQFGNKLLGALNTMISISGAYSSCAP